MNIGESAAGIFSWLAAAIVMVGLPVIILSSQNDKLQQTNWQQLTTELVTEVANTGELTQDRVAAYESALSASGVAVDIEMEIKVLDENPGKKTTQANYTKYGENTYYSIYDTQVDDLLSKDGKIRMNEGWIFIVKAKNASPTLAQDLDLVGSNDTYTYSAQASATVTTNAGY